MDGREALGHSVPRDFTSGCRRDRKGAGPSVLGVAVLHPLFYCWDTPTPSQLHPSPFPAPSHPHPSLVRDPEAGHGSSLPALAPKDLLSCKSFQHFIYCSKAFREKAQCLSECLGILWKTAFSVDTFVPLQGGSVSCA